MVRWPAPGRCKLRLMRDLGPITAAKIQRKLISHTLSVAVKARQHTNLVIHLAVSGLGPVAAARWGASSGADHTWLQGHGNLGMCMRRMLLRVHRETRRSHKVVLIGSDLPSLTVADLEEAVKTLDYRRIVLGSAVDGGYWLLGLGKELLRPVAVWPFTDISWGTDTVLNTTLRRACQLGFDPVLLSHRQDIDQVVDLTLWQR